jgi:hypothetical protein
MRYDYAYARIGTATGFWCTAPLTGWWPVDVCEQRPSVDWAQQVKPLLDDHYPAADQVRLVCDNLNTHKVASLYAACEPAEARRLARRLEFPHTPKHGSWWNSAEIELRVLSQPCLDRRMADLETVRYETMAWEHKCNAHQIGVDWQCTTDDARIRLQRLYPQYQG